MKSDLPMLVKKTVLMLACGLGAMAASRSAKADIFITGGSDGFNSTCNIRRAIRAVNSGTNDGACTGVSAGGNVINFKNVPVSQINSTLGIITLNAGRSVVFRGAGYTQTFVERDPVNGGTATNLVINGRADFIGMTFRNFQTKVIFADNSSTVSVSYVRFLNNKGNFTGSGGCMTVSPNASLQVQSTEFDFCEGTTGAAIANSGSLSVYNSTFVRNRGERGAAIFNNGTMTVTSSTFGVNQTTVYGSAIQNAGTASIYNSTIAYNVCNSSFPDLCTALSNSSGTMNVFRTVVAKNTGSTKPNCTGSLITSGGGNLFGETALSCSPHTSGVNDMGPQDPKLSVTTGNMPDYYGGVGRVYLPAADSVLLGALVQSNCFGEDQRGVGRLAESCDIGAVELGRALLVVNNASSLTTGDTKLKNTLTRLGFTVTAVSGTTTTAADTSGKILVLIAESVTSTAVNTKFRDVGVGVLVSEPSLFDDMRMTGTASSEFGSSSVSGVTVPDGDCPLGLAVGFTGFKATTSSSSAHAWGVQTFGPTQCASVSSTQWGIFRYGPGWSLPGGSFAPGARVGFFGMDAMLGGLNADGTRMLEESILMASGN